eukprot:TRINITY_DN11095_c2_g1_i1.p1 TRINITY_DN11095_c2_g1~~TRINITY_DN11095_c2_g1_i1.p1  ORF type:complete len:507 (+),score=73.34 TRINITY_DN11095_c2_g1_i1:67-1521(+)
MKLLQITVLAQGETEKIDFRKLPGEVLITVPDRSTPTSTIGSWKQEWTNNTKAIYTRRGYTCEASGPSVAINLGDAQVRVDLASTCYDVVVQAYDAAQDTPTYPLLTHDPSTVSIGIRSLQNTPHGVTQCRGSPPATHPSWTSFKCLIGTSLQTPVPLFCEEGLPTLQPWDYEANGIDLRNEENGTAEEAKKQWASRKEKVTITASEFGRAVGMTGRVKDYLEGKCCVGLDRSLAFTGNVATHHGVKSESRARQVYAENLGVTVLDGGFWVNPQKGYESFGASPDGIAGDRLLEIKCPLYGYPNHTKWDPRFKGIDPNYYCQMQGQLNIVNSETCDFFVWDVCTSSWCLWRVSRDKAFWESLLGLLSETHSYASGMAWLPPLPPASPALFPSRGAILPLIPPPIDSHLYPVFHHTHTAVAASLAAVLSVVVLSDEMVKEAQIGVFSWVPRWVAMLMGYLLPAKRKRKGSQDEPSEEGESKRRRV